MAPAVTYDYPASELPVATSPDGLVRVRVIAGEALGASCDALRTHVPINMLHFTVQVGAWVGREGEGGAVSVGCCWRHGALSCGGLCCSKRVGLLGGA